MNNIKTKQILIVKLDIPKILDFLNQFPIINKNNFDERIKLYSYFVKDEDMISRFAELDKNDQIEIILKKLKPVNEYEFLINIHVDKIIKKSTIEKKAFLDYYKIYLKYVFEGYNFSEAENKLLYKLKKEYEEFSHINLIQMISNDIKKINKHLTKRFNHINFT